MEIPSAITDHMAGCATIRRIPSVYQSGEPLRRQYWRHAKPLLLDGFLFLTVLAILLVSYVGLKILSAAGYDDGNIMWLENIHFLAYAAVILLFAFDMIMKVSAILFGGGR